MRFRYVDRRLHRHLNGHPHRHARSERYTESLVFFPSDTPPGRKRRRLLFVVILMTAAAALVWPVYPLFSGIFPLIMGLPLSMAWIALWLTVVFAALVWLYRSED